MLKQNLVYVRDQPEQRTSDIVATAPDHLRPLVVLLLKPDLLLVRALCEVVKKGQIEPAAYSLVHIFETGGRGMELITFLIGLEFESAKYHNTLFRDNTIASKALSVYNTMVARDYLAKTLRPLIHALVNSKCSLEIDRSRLGPDEVLEENVMNLRAATQMCLVRIFRSVDSYPLACRFICHQIMSRARKEVPEVPSLPYSLAGTFYFLRFICPAIVFPEKFGVWMDPIPESVRRTLTLLSRILQKLAQAEKSSKQSDVLQPLEPFIQSQTEKRTLHQFFDLVATPPVEDDIKYVMVIHLLLVLTCEYFVEFYCGHSVNAKVCSLFQRTYHDCPARRSKCVLIVGSHAGNGGQHSRQTG